MSIVTIKDVAARAGVSPKTVSRVINGEAHVRAEVREVVQRVVAEMDYRPNAFARGLSSSRSFMIGLFFDDPASGYAGDIQRGALTRARELSHHLLIEPLNPGQPDWHERLSATLREVRLGGAILTPPIGDSIEVIELFERHQVPVVRIAPVVDAGRTPSVRMDDRAAAREMTDYLLSLGHRDIAFIKGNPRHGASAWRWDGFRDAMLAAGLAPHPDRVLGGDFSFRSGIEAADTLLDAPSRPTAIFASNDEMALGVLVSAMRRQIAVPQALTVVGFDDAPISRMAWPQLTTIHQPNVEMAAAAVNVLIDPGCRSHPPGAPASLQLPYAFIERPSSGPVAAPA